MSVKTYTQTKKLFFQRCKLAHATSQSELNNVSANTGECINKKIACTYLSLMVSDALWRCTEPGF